MKTAASPSIPTETSREGIFAVGDVHGDVKLIAVAWAEGIQAAIHAFKEITSPYWLNEKRLRDNKIALIGEKITRAARLRKPTQTHVLIGRICRAERGEVGGASVSKSPGGPSQSSSVSTVALSGRDGRAQSGDIAAPIRSICRVIPISGFCSTLESLDCRSSPRNSILNTAFDYLGGLRASHSYFGHDD
jgi:hypothetical protein